MDEICCTFFMLKMVIYATQGCRIHDFKVWPCRMQNKKWEKYIHPNPSGPSFLQTEEIADRHMCICGRRRKKKVNV
jgi:hypothetical protein